MSKRTYFLLFLLGSLLLSIFFISDDKLNAAKSDVIVLKNDEFHDLKSGDIIFQASSSEQSKAIQLATNSRYSHVGLVYSNNNRFYVFEAIQPVKLTPLVEWIKRGEEGHYVVKRLKKSDSLLTPDKLEKIKVEAKKFRGKNYDLYFNWSDERIYCSELVWKIYRNAVGVELAELESLSDFDLSSSVVSAKLKERYGNNIPMKEKVISPAGLFNSDKLETVLESK